MVNQLGNEASHRGSNPLCHPSPERPVCEGSLVSGSRFLQSLIHWWPSSLIPLQSCSLRNARKIILHIIITKCHSPATPPAVVVPPGANSLMRSVTAPVGHRWRPPRSLRNFQHPRGTKELFELVQPHRYWTWLNCEDGWRRLRVECRLDHAWAYYIPAIPSMTSCLLI